MFRIDTDIIVLDLETTSAMDEDGLPIFRDIIQLGAVRVNKKLEIVSSFESLVKNREPISEEITQLTGITNEMCADAPSFDVVAKDFEFWLGPEPRKNVRMGVWGAYFDMPILRQHYKEYFKTKMPFSGEAYDIKSIALTYLLLRGERSEKLNIPHLMKLLGITAPGRLHDAGVDAQVEAQILIRCLLDMKNSVYINGEKFTLSKNP